jgi:hypothetical protein
MVETISNVTPIQQGMAPGANMPYKAIAELGARTDVRLKAAVEILEDYLTEINKLRINRFAQFYTVDRYYRIRDPHGNVIEGTLNKDEMLSSWVREEYPDPVTGQMVQKEEKFVPEFDIQVKIIDEKPTDRNYYTNTALQLFGMNLMVPEDVWYTLEEGKFPPKDEVVEKITARDQLAQIMQGMEGLPPEAQQAYMNVLQSTMANLQQGVQQMGGGQGGKKMQGGQTAQTINA